MNRTLPFLLFIILCVGCSKRPKNNEIKLAESQTQKVVFDFGLKPEPKIFVPSISFFSPPAPTNWKKSEQQHCAIYTHNSGTRVTFKFVDFPVKSNKRISDLQRRIKAQKIFFYHANHGCFGCDFETKTTGSSFAKIGKSTQTAEWIRLNQKSERRKTNTDFELYLWEHDQNLYSIEVKKSADTPKAVNEDTIELLTDIGGLFGDSIAIVK